LTDHFDIEMRIDSEPRYLCVVRAAVNAAVDRMGFDTPDCARIMLAVDEAITNVIRHGYKSRADQPIWIRMRPTDHEGNAGFTIVIEDVADQVDPSRIRGRDLEDLRPGGLGVHIIREVMDHVEFARREEKGMRLAMSKSLNHDSNTAASAAGRPVS
jgi:anti-sigma regulatory factor (Ser/Thr protein kinase)